MKQKRVSELTFPPGFDVCKSGISQTQCKNFLECRVKWLLYVNGYVPVGGIPSTNFGTIFHALLAYAYKNQKGTIADIPVDKIFAEVAKENCLDVASQDFQDVTGMVLAVFFNYLNYYKKDFTSKKFLKVEQDSYATINGFIRRVKTDALFEDHRRKLWLMESKTRGKVNEENLALVLGMDFQALYSITTIEASLKRELVGVLYNVIRTPQLKRKEGESLQYFCDRIDNDIKGRPEWYFIRMEIVYTEKDKARFNECEANGILSSMDCACRENLIYRNGFACAGQYRPCEMLSACSSDDLSLLKKVERRK
jgi:hypothetical protein